jgi:hypothetical protein
VKENEMIGNEMQQQVWRTANSDFNSSGYFVWEILEVVGHEGPIPSYFTECRDGSLILIGCYHHWTLESAGESLHRPVMDKYQTVSIVPEPRKEIKVGDYVASKRWKAQGIVMDVQECVHPNCTQGKEFTLDPDDNSVRFYYHVDSFDVIVQKQLQTWDELSPVEKDLYGCAEESELTSREYREWISSED